MSDVVERLRDWPAGGQDMLSSTVVGGMMEEAADEIERLREALRRIAEGNLGPQKWQADYDKIKEVARAALKGNQ